MRLHTTRSLHLLATTSVVALSLVAAPMAIDPQSPLPMLKVAMADSCCFTGETRVLMADGRNRPIRDIQVGDLVMGPSGACRVVRVERPRLGARPLYAFNGGPAFVTAEHPFATLGGWRSIEPAATASETPSLAVKQLLIGDCLQKTRGADSVGATAGNLALAMPALAIVALLSLKAEAAAPETLLYNLVLDGAHAYFANGYLVHNKGGDSGSGGGDSDGGDSDGGDSDGGDSGGDDSGGDSEGGESGGSGSGSSGSGGESGESGESGSSGSSSGSGVSGSSKSSGSSSSGASFSEIQPIGPDLTPSEEAEAISKGWQ